MLPHEKLQVYGKALAFVAAASASSAAWSEKHAVVDQLDRASESLILNLADGARHRSAPGKVRALDYAIGSGLECAACLDIARIKQLLGLTEAECQKQCLVEVVKMLIGLRKAWKTWKVLEEPVHYRVELPTTAPKPLFHHETLDVYRTALDLMTWLTSLPEGQDSSSRLSRKLDEGVTSVILNIAEGNGHYCELDHRRFLDIAEGAVAKVAACLDLAVENRGLRRDECGRGKNLLERIAAMLSRM